MWEYEGSIAKHTHFILCHTPAGGAENTKSAMGISGLLVASALLIALPSLAGADTALDFCVADLQAPSSPCGYACKKAALVTADDFAYSGLRKPGKTSNLTKVALATAFATQFPALNGLGLSMARADLQPGGVILSHTHPRAAELAVVIRGRVLVGFISTDNVPYSKILRKGDIMAVPQGLLHYLINAGGTTATIFVSFSSPTPGLQFTPYALFGNDLPADVVEKTTFISDPEVKRLKARLRGKLGL